MDKGGNNEVAVGIGIGIGIGIVINSCRKFGLRSLYFHARNARIYMEDIAPKGLFT